MNHDLSQSVSQGSDRAQDAENRRIAEIADELERLCEIYEAQHGVGKEHVSSLEIEQRAAEQLSKAQGFWLPISEIFSLGLPGPSGHENDTYIAEKVVYKVNNLLNSKSIIAFLHRILAHNMIFHDTPYSLYGFTGFEGRTIQPIIVQPRVEDAQPATRIMIETYMSALGFEKLQEGRYKNEHYEVWDLLPRNVLVDKDGDIYVVDAEIKRIK